MNKKKKWTCWLLSKDDIDTVALRQGLDPKDFNQTDYDDIARSFIIRFTYANDAWEFILEEAVKLHSLRKNPNKKRGEKHV